MRQQRKRLDGFAQAHVIRQHRAQPKAPEERQPGEAITLVGAQFAAQAGRLAQFAQRFLILQALQPVFHPAFRAHLVHFQAIGGRFAAQGKLRRFHQAHLAGLALFLPEVNGGFHLFGVELHPLTAHLHQRQLERRQGFKLLARQGGVAQRQLPLEAHQRVYPRQPRAPISPASSAG